MRSHQLLLSLLGSGSLVKAAKREAPDWGPWLPLPQGDRCLVGLGLQMIMIHDGF